MTSLLRRVIACPPSSLALRALWPVAFALPALAAFIVARACGYELSVVGRYAVYLALHVVLPGIVVTSLVTGAPLSLARVLALALPTGFALEILTFLGLSAANAKTSYPWVPLAWLAVLGLFRWRVREWPVRVHIAADRAGLWFGLGLAFLATALMAASQMFSEAPLAGGLPTRAIFHDWVYLVSRAGVIKNNWPLDDPSLSGTPLQYHYFMMVHAAAASWTTGIELSTIMLRLIFVPLGAVLVAQAYALGRAVSQSAWGGVLAALLLAMTSEASLTPSYGDSMFLELFARWLFVSPTFFFGMIFCGALLIGIVHCAQLPRCEARHYFWLLLLGMAGTGAKGTVLPVVICAVGLWTAWRWWRERRLPVRLLGVGLCLVLAFAIVYLPTMWAWRTGDATFRPFHAFQLTRFWKEFLPVWQVTFTQWLPPPLATLAATSACAAIIFAGTCGVGLLAIPYLFWGDVNRRDPLVASWLGAFFAASAGMGLLLELNSYGELYLLLMMRLPMAALTGAFFVATARWVGAWWRNRREAIAAGPGPTQGTGTVASVAGRHVWAVRLALGAGVLILSVALGMQTSVWWQRNQRGLGEWLSTPALLKPDDYMRELQEALLWVRVNTEPNAVLVANACTPENMKNDHWGALDRTLTGVHFYYSAISERRLWFEGPNYIMDTTRARLRASIASSFFYRGRPLPVSVVSAGPCYVLVDRSLKDGADVGLRAGRRVFTNARMDIYRITSMVADGS